MNRARVMSALQLATRAAAASLVALAVARILGLDFPLYAMIAAVIVTDLAPARTRRLAVPRLTGAVLGAGIGAVLASLPGHGPWTLAVGILVTMFVTDLLGWPDAARLAGYVCGIVLLEHATESWTCALHRLVETALGIGIAVLVSLVPKLIAMPAPSLQTGDDGKRRRAAVPREGKRT